MSECAPPPCWESGWKGRMKWLKTYLDQKGLCAICHKPKEPGEMTKDHIVPRGKGGGTDWDNIQLVCEPCNAVKGDKMPNEGP